MALTFQKLELGRSLDIFPDKARNTGYLRPNNWDDYGYKTLFLLTIFDEEGNE